MLDIIPYYSVLHISCQNPPLFTAMQMIVRIPHYSQSCKCFLESSTVHSSANACQNPHYSQSCWCLLKSYSIQSFQMLGRILHYSQSCKCLLESFTIHSRADACQNPPLFMVLLMFVRIQYTQRRDQTIWYVHIKGELKGSKDKW